MLDLLASHEIRLFPSNDPLDAAVRYKPHIAAIHAVPVHAGRPAKLTVCGKLSDPGASQPFDMSKGPICSSCAERIGRMSRRRAQAGSEVFRSQLNAKP
jgi:hypothetical protein